MRKFIDRRRPESAPDNPTSTALIGALLAGLDEALDGIPDGLGGVLANDPACRRKAAALKVRFAALRALELRALTGDDAALAEGAALTEGAALAEGAALTEGAAADVLGILCTELRLDVGRLLLEALGYYALPMPDERPGNNEAPLGGAYARLARQGMLAGLLGFSGTLDAQRDRLARKLLEAADTGESDAGH